jgi:predicted NAD-dependent protein-ADP-ribosyltransferase YbiA (DUF1768 family)
MRSRWSSKLQGQFFGQLSLLQRILLRKAKTHDYDDHSGIEALAHDKVSRKSLSLAMRSSTHRELSCELRHDMCTGVARCYQDYHDDLRECLIRTSTNSMIRSYPCDAVQSSGLDQEYENSSVCCLSSSDDPNHLLMILPNCATVSTSTNSIPDIQVIPVHHADKSYSPQVCQ